METILHLLPLTGAQKAAFQAARTPGGAQRSGSGGEEEAQRNE